MVDVTVTTAGGTSPASPADRFSYVPSVSTVNPTSGPTTGNTPVTIDGAGFTNASAVVDFGSTPATNVVVNSDGTQITATSPAGTGVVDVTVKTAGGTSATSSADRFTYLALSATPTITWPNPADITYGTALGSTQLDATANVAGNFAYNPPIGTVLAPVTAKHFR